MRSLRPLVGSPWAIPLSCLGLLLAAPPAPAQQPYPIPRLTALTPSGAKAGASVESTLAGADLDEATALYFSHPGLKAERLPEPPPPKDKKDKKKNQKPPPPQPPRFKITVAPNTPLGVYDVRVVGKWGVSNPRAFTVGTLNEVLEKEPNNDVPQAQKVNLGDVVNGVSNPRVDVDYYAFAGKKGQRVVLHCAASTVDSRLNPLLQLFGPDDKELASNRGYRDRNAVIEQVLPADGDYRVRVCEFTYLNGGPEYFYRLSLSDGPWLEAVYPPVVEAGKTANVTLFGRNLPGGQPVPGKGPKVEQLPATVQAPPRPQGDDFLAFGGTLLPRSGSLDGFEFRLNGTSNPALVAFADAPVVLDNENNDTPEQAQPIAVPCELCGRIEKVRDADWYRFPAKKGDVFYLEGFADRLQAPLDLYFSVRRADNKQAVGLFDDHPDIPVTIGRFYTRTGDPQARFVVPADGEYELLVRSHTADFLAGPRRIYRLSVRKPEPDFRLVVIDNNDPSTGGCTLRQGGNQDLDVVCFRRDGFEGEVELSAEGLPSGVTYAPQVLGPKAERTSLVLTAAPNAPAWTGPLTVKGTAVVDGKKIVRAARAGTLVWPAPNNAPAISRLARSVCLAVRAPGPYTLDVPVKQLALPVGGNVGVKVRVQPRGDFKASVQLDSVSGPAQANGKPLNLPKVNIAPGKEGEVKLNLPNNALPGTYNLVFRGTAKYPFERTKGKKANVDVSQVTPPIKLTVYNQVADLAIDNSKVVLKAGGEVPVVVKLKRLHDYKGDFQVQLVVPQGFQGVSAQQVKVPAGANEFRLVLKAPKGAKPASNPNFLVRAVARVNNVNLTQEAKFALTLADAKTAVAPGGGEVQTIKLVPAGSDGWRYLPAAQASGNNWLVPSFDDKAWRAARSPIGYGEPEVQNRKGTLIAEKGQPLRFRRAFDVPADLLKQKGVALRLNVASDDSAVVYLNGKKVDEDTADHEFQYWNRDVQLPAAALVPGRNVLAVEVKNGAGSSDLFLDLELAALAPKKK